MNYINCVVPIIVLNYNDYNTTIEYLERTISEINDTYYRIVVVDNKSTNDSFDRIKRLSKIYDFDLIMSDYNGGYSYGNNYGIRYAIAKYKPEYIIISNPDVWVGKSQLDAMVDELYREETVKIVSCKMYDKSGKLHRYGWRLPTYGTELWTSFPLCFRLFGSKLLEYPSDYFTNETSYVDVVCGSLFAVKKEAIEEIGFFDENVFLYGEEQIIGYKLKQLGYQEKVINTISFIHAHGVSINKSISKEIDKYELHQKSKRYYLKEYLKIGKIRLCIFDVGTKIGYIERLIIFKLIIKKD